MISQEVESLKLCLRELLLVLWWLDWHCLRCDVSLGCFNERAKNVFQMAGKDMELACNASPFTKESNTTSE